MISKIFIGSSSHALPYASQLSLLLKEDNRLDPVVWNEPGVFDISETYIESLSDALSNFDFAIMLFHPDDTAEIKGERVATTRDNVVFEYGLFIGKLGRNKCYVVQPSNISLRIPSDVTGVSNAQYNYEQTDDPGRIKELLAGAAKVIRDRIISVSRERTPVVRKGQVINGCLHMASTQRSTYIQLETCIRKGNSLPEEILYWSVESANAWIDYEQDTFENASLMLGKMSREINKVLKNEQLNFISLGCGSGSKDVLLLNMLSPDKRRIRYFPVDQSYTLLENAIGEALENINSDDIYIKGIRADFTKLLSFRSVFAKKNVLNIFSLLGCTLGNYNEIELLSKIVECMEPGDLLLLEVALLTEELDNAANGTIIESGKYADHNLQDFLLSPARPFVKNLTRDCLRFVIERDSVFVKDSVRVIVKFDNKDLPEQKPFDIAYSTHYKMAELVAHLKEENKLDTIYNETYKKNIYLLCQKPLLTGT